MDKLVENNPTDFSIYSEDAFGKTYKFPKRLITIRGKHQKCVISEEQREIRRERMKQINRAKADSSVGNTD